MKESYIQAIILGLLIGGAIILDDFIGPKPKKFADRVFMEHKGKNSITQMKKVWKDDTGKVYDIKEEFLIKEDSDKGNKKIMLKIDGDDIAERNIDVEEVIERALSEASDSVDVESIRNNLQKALEGIEGKVQIEVRVEKD
jgi:hypothetical protein|tara:strand:+ start:426 stop:848 length:423 start_codon:yes stop_codon:yes gene_type:complete